MAILDNSATSMVFQPWNSLLSKTWRGEMNDTELVELTPILKDLVGSNESELRNQICNLPQGRNAREAQELKLKQYSFLKKGELWLYWNIISGYPL